MDLHSLEDSLALKYKISGRLQLYRQVVIFPFFFFTSFFLIMFSFDLMYIHIHRGR